MYLQQLDLFYFRNYLQEELKLTANKVILLGNNAQGKSNLLEAIELLSSLKSHRTSKDSDLVFNHRVYAQIKALVKRKFAEVQLNLRIPIKGKRELIVNQEKLKKNIDFLGIINSVLFSSLDLDLVRGSPEYRRNWVDDLLVQLEPIYTYINKEYNHILKQRNSLLKQVKKQGCTSYDSLPQSTKLQLSLWDDKLAENGARVTRRRARVLRRLEPLAKFWHSQISHKTEKLQIVYQPNVPWQEDHPEMVKMTLKKKLEQQINWEINLGTTIIGPHRDEIEFKINETLAKGYGSQGQQRTLVLALKLAELQLIEQVIGEPPLLLLDDVLAELDLQRQRQLLESLGDRFQTFITTTHLNYFDSQLLANAQIIEVKQGKFLNSEF
jgi:DNA replication and repair protein RecF